VGRWQRWQGWTGGGWRGTALLAAGALLVLGLLGGIAMADDALPLDQATSPDSTPGRADEAAPPYVKSVVRREKLDGALAAIAEAAVTSGDEAALASAQAGSLAVSGGTIRVLVESANPDLTPAKAAIVAAGGTVESEYADTIQAMMPPSGLDAVAASPDVRYVRAPAGRTPGGMPGRAP
jgi:hypothetical protein